MFAEREAGSPKSLESGNGTHSGVPEMDRKDWVNLKALKQSITMERLLDHYGLLGTLRRRKNHLMGVCPIHRGSNPFQFHVSLTKNKLLLFRKL